MRIIGLVKKEGHSTVCDSKKEFARDDDGDSIKEVHCNSCEGLWAELRNHLRTFKGVDKKYLAQYVVMFENAFNFRDNLEDLLRAMLIPDYVLRKTHTLIQI